MVRIHHTQVKQAAKLGIQLYVNPLDENLVVAKLGDAQKVAPSAREALALMLAGLVFNQSAVATDQTVTGSNAFNYVSVMPGDTLWELAETYSEGKSQQDWIAEVILLNNLSSATLTTGDKLALP